MIGVVLHLLLYAFKACVGTAWSYKPLIKMNRVIYGEAERGREGKWLEFTAIYGIRSAIIVFG